MGLAGDPYLDCNSGLCEKLVKKIMRERCYYSRSEYSFNAFNKRRLSSCETYSYDCSFTQRTSEFKCSEECSSSNSLSFCYSCSYKYDSEKGRCNNFHKFNLRINDTVYCKPSNIIVFWKLLYYAHIIHEYSYANDTALKNEACPDGRKPCGIVEEYGNKLCLPKNEKYPIYHLNKEWMKVLYDYKS